MRPSSTITTARLIDTLSAYTHNDRKSLPGRTNHMPGAILLPLMLDDALNCIVTVRPNHLRMHGGEVVFPGGRPEAEDINLQATALRETREELGIDQVEIVGRLSTVPLYTSDFLLHPFIGVVPPNITPLPNHDEVETVHFLSIRAILAGDTIHAIPFQLPQEAIHLSPVFEVDDQLMYGGTAATFLECLSIIASLLDTDVPPLTPGKYDWQDIMPSSVPKPSYKSLP